MRFIPLHSKSTSLLALAFFGIGLTSACSPSANNGGSGGSSNSGGSNGSGGNSSGSGGNKGSGGSTSGSGGTSAGSGGSTSSSGGKVGSGGTSSGSGGASTGSGGKGSGGSTGSGGGASTSSGGATGSGGSTTGSGGGTASGSGGVSGSGGSTGAGGMIAGCMNTDQSSINIDSSGFICNNQWGIKGAWYCYTGDTSAPCNKTGAIPYNATSKGMCMSGTNAAQADVVMGFKVNSGPPGDSATPTTWDASKIVGFAVTLAPGASMKGSGGAVLEIGYPTTNDQDNANNAMAAPGVVVPGVGTTPVTYNALFSDSVLSNDATVSKMVDPANLTDLKVTIPRDSVSHTYDFCITKVVPLMTAPSPVVATGAYGPSWSNNLPQAVNGVNGYAVQSTPFDKNNGLPMTMQVNVTATGVGFTYKATSTTGGNMPSAFPAVISGWGPGEAGIQFYGPYKVAKTIAQLTSVKSTWTYTMGSSGDAVYDVWFGNSAQPAKPQTELMIWIGNKDKGALGSAVSGATGVGGKMPWVASDNGTGQQVVSYWIDKGTTGTASNLELLDYFKDAANNKYAGLSTGSFLLGVQTGFEVYSTDTWTTTDYNITIQ